ncbi:MAG: nucleotidyltransferase family protein [Acidimicrobiales bacterium]
MILSTTPITGNPSLSVTYESGARQPSLSTLARLVSATGLDLDVRVTERQAPDRLDGPLGQRVHHHRRQVHDVVARYRLANPRLFGSVARGEERPDSDIDLLVNVPPGVGLLTLGRCQAELEQLLGARVDLVPADDLKPGVGTEVLAEAVAV